MLALDGALTGTTGNLRFKARRLPGGLIYGYLFGTAFPVLRGKNPIPEGPPATLVHSRALEPESDNHRFTVTWLVIRGSVSLCIHMATVP